MMGAPRYSDLPPLPPINVRPPCPAGSGPALPPVLATALRRAQAAEQAATGYRRVPAFRLTRSLIAGARVAGYPIADIAACLGVSLSAVRGRGGSDGWISAVRFAELADVHLGTIEQWAVDRLLSTAGVDAHGQRCYPASELVCALIHRVEGSSTALPVREVR
jgi:hypothetical protein